MAREYLGLNALIFSVSAGCSIEIIIITTRDVVSQGEAEVGQ